MPIYTVKVTAAWWLKWFLYAVSFAAAVTGQVPDQDKLAQWIRRGLKLKLVPWRAWLAA